MADNSYFGILLDRTVLDQYPDDVTIPGIENNIIEDKISDATQIVLEETAGPSEHLA